ncbi:MAG: DUF2586 family protein [Bacteroidales bacterium]|nr:DUF2586 family protein [Bacteroidales bacterium]
MALPGVNIIIETGGIGRVDNPGNGIPGLLVQMAASPAGHAFGDVVAYKQWAEMPTELQAVPGLGLYFKEAPGYKVYIMPVASTTVIADLVNHQHATPYGAQLVQAGNGEIRFIGVMGTLLAAGMVAARTNAQAFAEYFAAAQNPVAVFLPYSYRAADTPANLKAGSQNRVGIAVSYRGDEIGLLMGTLAKSQVHQHPGKVKNGSLPMVTAYLDGVAATLIEDQMTMVETLHDLGYIMLRVIVGKSGYYWAGMPMATASTDDYATIVNRRTIDKAHVIAYATYIEELNNEVFVTSDGKLQPGYCKEMEAKIEKAIDLQMGAEISGREAYIDTEQFILQTGQLDIRVSIIPVGHNEFINIYLGLTATLQ